MIRDGLKVKLPPLSCSVECQGCGYYREIQYLGTAARIAARHIKETSHAVRVSRGATVLVNYPEGEELADG